MIRPVAVVLAVAGLAIGMTSAASAATTAQAARATARTVLRPVTAGGRPAAGFTVTNLLGADRAADCSFPLASPVAVTKNVELCAPDADDAVACWKAAVRGTTLCFMDARRKHLIRFRLRGRFAPTARAKHPVPLDLRLGNGEYCQWQVGPTGELAGHPNLFSFYLCAGGRAIWGRQTSTTDGINEAGRVWTVRVGPQAGRGRLVVRRVAHAWFVGTRG